MGYFWTVHQVLKPILGPSSSHTSAPFVMGYIFHNHLVRLGFEPTIDSLEKNLRITILCPNPSRAMYSFIGHRSIRALIFGLLGGYFSSDRRRIFDDVKRSLEKKKEYDLIHTFETTFNALEAEDVAYKLEVSYGDRTKVLFDSVGGGIIGLCIDNTDIEGVITSLFPESIPLWIYLSYDTLERLESKLPFTKKDVALGKKFFDDADEIIPKEIKDETVGAYVARRENNIVEESRRIAEELWEIMYESTSRPPNNLRYSKFLKYEISKEMFSGNDMISKVLRYTMNVAVRNAEMHIIVSAPTGGASSIFPATLRGAMEEFGIKQEEIINGLYVGGLIGGFIGNNMSVSGSLHGCQAEIGVSLAMAASAIVDMLADTSNIERRVKMVFDAASIALQSIQGLACDPLMGFVEVPCVLRNLAFIGTPFVIAKMISSGYRPVIALRTAIRALKKTGELLNKALRESGTGPLTCMYILAKMEEKGIEEELISLFEREIY